jgi:hypothetical protein
MYRLRQALEAKSVFRQGVLNYRGTRWRAPTYTRDE